MNLTDEMDASIQNSVLVSRRSANDDNTDDKKTRKRGKAKKYKKVYEIDSFQETETKMKELEAKWTYRHMRETNEGDKYTYTCKNHPKCPKQLVVNRRTEGLTTTIWVSEDGHDHANKTVKGPLPKQTVELVKTLIDNKQDKNSLDCHNCTA
jgi:hypothetical protein